jgi:hypothetical protein
MRHCSCATSPARGGVLKWDRHWIATVLIAQVSAGAALGIAAQAFLVWVIIGYVMPFFAWSCSTWPEMWPPSIWRAGGAAFRGAVCSEQSRGGRAGNGSRRGLPSREPGWPQ